MKSRRAAWALLAIAFVVALAHVCVLPGHSHAESTAPHESRHDNAALHTASCDAVRPASTALLMPVVPVASIADRFEASTAKPSATPAPPPSPAISPPLFLLHASLLI
jgi:hypothetical protein